MSITRRMPPYKSLMKNDLNASPARDGALFLTEPGSSLFFAAACQLSDGELPAAASYRYPLIEEVRGER